MTEAKPAKRMLSDEVLRLVQIVSILLAVGMFVQQSRTATAVTLKQADQLEDLRTTVSRQGDSITRAVVVLDELERRMRANELDDAQSHSFNEYLRKEGTK